MVEFYPNAFFFGVGHQNYEESETLRQWVNDNDPDYILLDLPQDIGDDLIDIVEKLPEIYGLSFKLFNGENYWLSNDPCEVVVEAIRQSQMKRIPIVWGGEGTLLYPRTTNFSLDPFIRKSIGGGQYEVPFYEENIDLEYVPEGVVDYYKNVEAHLKSAKAKGKKTLVISCPEIMPYMAYWLANPEKLPQSEEETLGFHEFKSFPIHPDSLYFALGEWPVNTGEYEKARRDIFSAVPNLDQLFKRLLIRTKKHYLKKGEALQKIGPARLQKILDFARRLALIENRVKPTLIDFIEASKGVLGDRFTLQLIKAAKDYPYFDPTKDDTWVKVNGDGYFENDELVDAPHLFRDFNVFYEPIKLKTELPKEQTKDLKSQWDSRRSCSHLPEDVAIEGFNSRARKIALSSNDPENVRVTPFSTDLGEGIDVRETLRHFGENRVYIKETPPTKFKADTVLLLFDIENDEKYPNQMVWFAEHDQESTLSFYATEALDKMIGPGIAELEYGGLSLLFPPRPTFNPFESRKATKGYSLAEKLLWGAILNTEESHIVVCCEQKPTPRMHEIAKIHNKFLIHVSFSQFGQETLDRLRRFHMLNGNEVRSWAKRFIGY